MKIGYIKINGIISQIFINKDDSHIASIVKSLREKLQDMDVDVTWDNKLTDKTMDELLTFLNI